MRKKPLINPLIILAGKQKMTEQEVQDFEFPAWTHLDLVLAGKAENDSINVITRYVVMTQIMSVLVNDRKLYDFTVDTVQRWLKALDLSAQRNAPPDLSTSTKAAIKGCIGKFSALIRKIDLKTAHAAAVRWVEIEKEFIVDWEKVA